MSLAKSSNVARLSRSLSTVFANFTSSFDSLAKLDFFFIETQVCRKFQLLETYDEFQQGLSDIFRSQSFLSAIEKARTHWSNT